MEYHNQLEYRNAFFAQMVKPSNFPKIEYSSSNRIAVNVWRNIGVEHVFSIVANYVELYGFEPSFNFSFYDSTIDLRRHKTAALEIIYQEVNENNKGVFLDLIKSKIKELNVLGAQSVGVVLQINEEIEEVFDLDSLKIEFSLQTVLIVSKKNQDSSSKFSDHRLLDLTGNWLSSMVSYRTAREIACCLLLPYLIPEIKVIAVDLDNTLYHGVLVEDDFESLHQSNCQISLINWIRQQKKRGIITAIVSRNHESDVTQLLTKSQHLDLNLEDFDFIFASWEPKEKLIAKLLDVTRVGEESVLFLDDSPAEVAQVKKFHKKISSVLFADLEETMRFLEFFPGLQIQRQLGISNIDRANDLKQNEMRMSIFEKFDHRSAFKELEILLEFEIDNLNLLPRAAELARKTNQFNANLSRYTESQLETFLTSGNRFVITAHLKDKLSISGVVSLIVGEFQEEGVILLDEFCISCRALGRGLESEILFGSLKRLAIFSHFQGKNVIVKTKVGPRNAPFFEWAAEWGLQVESDGSIMIPWTDIQNWVSNLESESL